MAQLKIDLVLNKIQAMTGLRSFESNVMSVGKRLAGFVGIGGGIAGIATTIQGLLDKASRLQDLSDAFNVSSESIQRLGNVASTSNVSLEEVGAKLGKLAKAAQEAANDTGGELAQAFQKIGVTAGELNTLSPEQLFDRLREAVQSGKLAGDEFSVVGKLLAKDFQRLMPLLRMTSDEFNRLASAGGIMSDSVVTSLDTANIQIRLFQEKISKHMATAAADILTLGKIIKETPSLAFELFTATDLGPIEKVAERYRQIREELQKQITTERQLRRGDPSLDETQSKERIQLLEKEAKRETDFELEIIEARLDGRRRAEQILENFEERAAQDKIRSAEERGRATQDAMDRIEDIRAERAGPEAERNLLAQRASEAADLARKTQSAQDTLAAEQISLALQKSIEDAMVKAGFDPSSVGKMAFRETQAITGQLPQLNQPGGQEGQPAPLDSNTFQQTSFDMVEQFLTGTEKIAQSLRDIAATPTVIPVGPDLGKLETETGELRSRVQQCVDRLDAILRASGTFGV